MDEALENDVIKPAQGTDEEYDTAQAEVHRIEESLEELRVELSKKLKIGKKEIVFKDIGKEIFQLEISVKQIVPKDWKLTSKTQKVNRYYTPELQSVIQEFLEAREIKDAALRNAKANVFKKFDVNYAQW
ncbi:DNA mismatch repair protein msh6 [Nowakowskiella sp. JEL0078]|nr:DNA mismatch repair protein msh6 [Nowakowskiella sp. JEL0078]